jgi:hypothetical protein
MPQPSLHSHAPQSHSKTIAPPIQKLPTPPTFGNKNNDGSATNLKALEVPGMGVGVAVLLLPGRRWRPKKQRRVYHGLPERKLRHCGGHNGSASAMGLSPDKGAWLGAVCLPSLDQEGVKTVCQSMMAPWAIERADRAQRQREEEGLGGGGKGTIIGQGPGTHTT